MGRRLLIGIAVAAAAFFTSSSARALTNAQIPGLQVALRAHGLYSGPIDGIAGQRTVTAVRTLQRRTGLTVDGIAGIHTRVALGKLGRPLFGRRTLAQGNVGWDVSVLQFLLVEHGYAGVGIDGHFGPRTTRAVRRFQRRQQLLVDGVVGGDTRTALDPSGSSAPAQGRPSGTPMRHTVRAGESLTSIAARYGTTVEALAEANGRDPGRVLLAGTRLRVTSFRPARAAEAATSSAAEVRAALDRWSQRYGLDPQLVRALAWMESGYQQHLVSSAGAVGVMQVIPPTWDFVETALLGRRVANTTEGNIRVGVTYLHHLLWLFHGDERLALAAYYQGAKAVREHGILPQTRPYVANVLALKSRV